MSELRPLKVSYCTTCKGRLHHLRETLPANMAAEKDNPNVEFVVLDYGSKDGLGDWIESNFRNELASGRLKYVRTEAEHFKMAHAKNMAHRLGTGDVLCNLDADNFIAPNFSRWLNAQFAHERHGIVTCQSSSLTEHLGKIIHNRFSGRKNHSIRGLGGKIALRRDDFEGLGGYDEKYTAWGEEDINLIIRAREGGLKMIVLPQPLWGSAIMHNHDERTSQMSEADTAISMQRLGRKRFQKVYDSFKRLAAHPKPVVNPTGNVGCGMVNINFADEAMQIEPLASEMLAVAPAVGQESGGHQELRADWVKTLGIPTHTHTPAAQR